MWSRYEENPASPLYPKGSPDFLVSDAHTARLRQEWTQADHILENAVDRLGERKKLAVQCLIVRGGA